MRERFGVAFAATVGMVAVTAVTAVGPGAAGADRERERPSFEAVSTFDTGFGEGAAEIVAYGAGRLFVVNAAVNSMQIVDIADVAAPRLVADVPFGALGGQVNSVSVHGGLVAAAVEAEDPMAPGLVAFFDLDGVLQATAPTGVLPDMVTFTPNGRFAVTADEGQPAPDYSADPLGSVSIIDVRRALHGRGNPTRTVDFREFDEGGSRHRELPAGVRVFGPGSSVSQDLEPEYVAVDHRSETAYVTLQENNAVAVVDLDDAEVEEIMALGLKDHVLAGHGLDPSDRDTANLIGQWPVKGMYQPDGIAVVRWKGDDYLLTANEGDARDYDGFAEEIRVGSAAYVLDPTAFPTAAALKANAALGRLTVSTASGDTDGDGDFDEIHVFGARSLSVWDEDGIVWDGGDQLEQLTAARLPANFNAGNSNDTRDDRSDNKGPEPEGVTTGRIGGRTYAFLGLERIGGVAIYDVTNPTAPQFVDYVNDRAFDGAPPGPALGPEGVLFVPANSAPGGVPTLVVANEISGTVSIFQAA